MVALLRNEDGFTVMEVLVGAFIFMVGFGVVILLLNGTLLRISTKELTAAGGLAQDVLEQSIAAGDTLTLDTLVQRSGMTFRLERTCTVNDGLVSVRVEVGRVHRAKTLVDLYYEHSPYSK